MRFRLGVNYWPASTAMAWWRRFDRRETADDFARIASAGFDTIRIFLLWEDFQPEAARVSVRSLDRLVEAAEAAGDRGLSLILTLFTGHMSGANWIPRWALGPGEGAGRFPVISGGQVVPAAPANWYEDRELQRSQVLLAREVASALRGHPAVWAWDLGNESSNCVVPPSRRAALDWMQRIAEALRSFDAKSPITIGLHMEDLEEDRNLGPQEAGRVCDFLSMHAYPIYCQWAEGPADEHLAPFLGAITEWLGGREVLMEEIGAPAAKRQAPPGGPPILDFETAAGYTERVLRLVYGAGFPGALLWCYRDYAESLWPEPPFDRAPHELFFGLWRADGSPKPVLDRIRALAASPRKPVRRDLKWIGMAPEEFYRQPREHLRRLYPEFRERGPSLILEGTPEQRCPT